MPERALPPVIVLLSDGQPTDDYKRSLEKLKKLPWFRKAVKIAISIGQDADDDVLVEFCGNNELVLQANNAATLAKMIKWASTTASMVSAPSSKPINSVPASAPVALSLIHIFLVMPWMSIPICFLNCLNHFIEFLF